MATAGNSEEQRLLRRLRLRQLQLLVALDQHRNLRRAAQSLAIAQPAATRLLREMEALFGVSLFDRHARGMDPNAYGAILIRHARLVLLNLTRARSEIEDLRKGAVGWLNVGAIMGAIPAVLARTIDRLRRTSPQLRIRIHHAGTSDSLLPALHDGSIDLAIARLTERAHTGYRFEPLFKEVVCVIAAADHPLARRRKLTLRDIAQWPWILQPPTSPMRQQIDLLFQQAGLAPPDERIETSSMLATTHLLPGSQLLAAVPVDVAAGLAGDAVCVLPVNLQIGLGVYGIVTLDGQELPPAGLRFVAALSEEAARRGKQKKVVTA